MTKKEMEEMIQALKNGLKDCGNIVFVIIGNYGTINVSVLERSEK